MILGIWPHLDVPYVAHRMNFQIPKLEHDTDVEINQADPDKMMLAKTTITSYETVHMLERAKSVKSEGLTQSR